MIKGPSYAEMVAHGLNQAIDDRSWLLTRVNGQLMVKCMECEQVFESTRKWGLHRCQA